MELLKESTIPGPKDQLIDNPAEVITVLESFLLSEDPLLLWQQRGRIIKSWSIIKQVNLNSNHLIVRPQHSSEFFRFDPLLPIYIKNQSGHIFIKTNIDTFCRKYFLKIEIPKELFILNARISPRYNLEERNIDIYYNNFTTLDYSLSSLNQRAKLVDISTTGVALKLNAKGALYPNDSLLFSFINNISFPQKTSGQVIYVKKMKSFSESDYYKVGIHFDQSIHLQNLLQQIHGN